MGIDTGRVFALTWAVGITCVGVAGVLLAPIYPVYPTVGLQFVLIAYVAVVLGGLGDMAGALIASLIVAAVEVVGLLRDRHGVEGSAVPAPLHRDPRRPTRRALRSARRRGDRHVRGTWPAVVFFALAALVPVVVRDAFLLDGLVLILLWGAAAAAWNVAGGYAGQVSLGHAAFFGLGAYSAALLGTRWGLSPWIGLLVGAGAGDRLRVPHRLPQQPAARARTSCSPPSRSRRCC